MAERTVSLVRLPDPVTGNESALEYTFGYFRDSHGHLSLLEREGILHGFGFGFDMCPDAPCMDYLNIDNIGLDVYIRINK